MTILKQIKKLEDAILLMEKTTDYSSTSLYLNSACNSSEEALLAVLYIMEAQKEFIIFNKGKIIQSAIRKVVQELQDVKNHLKQAKDL